MKEKPVIKDLLNNPDYKDVIGYILSFLTPTELQTARTVSKLWFQSLPEEKVVKNMLSLLHQDEAKYLIKSKDINYLKNKFIQLQDALYESSGTPIKDKNRKKLALSIFNAVKMGDLDKLNKIAEINKTTLNELLEMFRDHKARSPWSWTCLLKKEKIMKAAFEEEISLYSAGKKISLEKKVHYNQFGKEDIPELEKQSQYLNLHEITDLIETAAENNNVELIELLLKQVHRIVDFNEFVKKDKRPIISAATIGAAKSVSVLLDISHQKELMYALNMAIYYGQNEIIKMLLPKIKIDTAVKNEIHSRFRGLRPITIEFFFEDRQLIDMLFEKELLNDNSFLILTNKILNESELSQDMFIASTKIKMDPESVHDILITAMQFNREQTIRFLIQNKGHMLGKEDLGRLVQEVIYALDQHDEWKKYSKNRQVQEPINYPGLLALLLNINQNDISDETFTLLSKHRGQILKLMKKSGQESPEKRLAFLEKAINKNNLFGALLYASTGFFKKDKPKEVLTLGREIKKLQVEIQAKKEPLSPASKK